MQSSWNYVFGMYLLSSMEPSFCLLNLRQWRRVKRRRLIHVSVWVCVFFLSLNADSFGNSPENRWNSFGRWEKTVCHELYNRISNELENGRSHIDGTNLWKMKRRTMQSIIYLKCISLGVCRSLPFFSFCSGFAPCTHFMLETLSFTFHMNSAQLLTFPFKSR